MENTLQNASHLINEAQIEADNLDALIASIIHAIHEADHLPEPEAKRYLGHALSLAHIAEDRIRLQLGLLESAEISYHHERNHSLSK